MSPLYLMTLSHETGEFVHGKDDVGGVDPVHPVCGVEPVHPVGGVDPIHPVGGVEPVHPVGGVEPRQCLLKKYKAGDGVETGNSLEKGELIEKLFLRLYSLTFTYVTFKTQSRER